MPALPVVPFTVRIDTIHSEGGDPGLGNRTFWRYSAGHPSNGDCSVLASTVASLWNQLIMPFAHPDTALTEVVVTDLDSTSGGRGIWTGSHPGTASGGPLPDNCCTLINFTLQRRYRGGKPRIYLPIGTATDVSPGEQQWIQTYVTNVNTAWSQLTSNLNGNGFGGSVLHEQSNVSYYSGVNKNGIPETPPGQRVKNVPTVRSTTSGEPIAGHNCNIVIGSQRRRLRA